MKKYYKINKSSTKLSPHYWFICFFCINNCCDCKSIGKLFDFFWTMFNSKTVKISNFIIYWLQTNQMSSNIRIPVKICYISPSFILSSRLSLEKTPLNLGSFIMHYTKNEVFHLGFLQLMWENPQQTADLVTLTEEILNGKRQFLCSDTFVFPY